MMKIEDIENNLKHYKQEYEELNEFEEKIKRDGIIYTYNNKKTIPKNKREEVANYLISILKPSYEEKLKKVEEEYKEIKGDK